MVFDPVVSPKDRVSFMKWYEEQTAWDEPHDYSDSSVTTTTLRAWYDDMSAQYPNMNGRDVAEGDLDDPKLTDYSIGRSIIYMAFAWSQAEDAYEKVRRLAEKHNVGFFDVSANEGEIWTPQIDRPHGKATFWQRLFGRG